MLSSAREWLDWGLFGAWNATDGTQGEKQALLPKEKVSESNGSHLQDKHVTAPQYYKKSSLFESKIPRTALPKEPDYMKLHDKLLNARNELWFIDSEFKTSLRSGNYQWPYGVDEEVLEYAIRNEKHLHPIDESHFRNKADKQKLAEAIALKLSKLESYMARPEQQKAEQTFGYSCQPKA